MKSLITLILIITISLPSIAQNKDVASETTTYYFIRHAEKDRSDKTNRDPELTKKGKKRADHWSVILQHVKFDAVYSTKYNRTIQTATPTAKKNGLEVTFYDPRTLYSDTFAEATKGQTVLVVGHSNTTPAFVNMVLQHKKYDDIDDKNNGNLYIVTISEGQITDTVLTINEVKH
ncbi:SixA phosphatase family protein [Psychroserpens algicola]|uniref:Histidine phosphatase family protein n=1 Tax=Psychroserpens algicola TaxID=1719034 RepID=A0ABT0H9T1_9FLAO|nr:phosphoglycerate mutase family protein [Psychroserpens algicola]MCK8481146.1 histidine phosphatase family protein [Psychroserpens algicola]